MNLKILSTLLASAVAVAPLSAFELSPLFGDHMVVQRQFPIAIFGTGDPGEFIEITLSSDSEERAGGTRVNADGQFLTYLEPLEAGTGYSLILRSEDMSEEFNDILIGDVWICSGQSNMAFVLTDSIGAEKTIAGSENSQIRLFKVPRNNSDTLAPRVKDSTWQPCGPRTAPSFSAVGYFFGKFVEEALDVPIGLIQSAWGGTQVESWTSQKSLLAQDDPERFRLDSLGPPRPPEAMQPTERRINALFKEFNATLPDDRRIDARMRSSSVPIRASNLFNGMIHPLLGYPIKGAIWYQGESNAGRAAEYRNLFPLMIEDWRRQWGIGDFPFYFVQLANYMDEVDEPADDKWAELREAQTMALDLPKTGMAVIIDIGEGDDIHPRNKRDVGHRLALQALQKTYGKTDLIASGPVLKKDVPEGSRMRLYFEHGKGELVLRDDTRPAFELASKNGSFFWADAYLENGTIVLKCDQVPDPAFVRYAWAANPAALLYNDAGLPASPFRTDTREGITKGNRYQPNAIAAASRTAFSEKGIKDFLDELEWSETGGYKVAVSGSDGNPASHLFDGNLNTRWSSLGLEERVLIDLGKPTKLKGLSLALFNGDTRRTVFKVDTSSNLKSWQEGYFGWSSGNSNGLESVPLSASSDSVRYLLLTFYGNTSNMWNSVTEVVVE